MIDRHKRRVSPVECPNCGVAAGSRCRWPSETGHLCGPRRKAERETGIVIGTPGRCVCGELSDSCGGFEQSLTAAELEVVALRNRVAELEVRLASVRRLVETLHAAVVRGAGCCEIDERGSRLRQVLDMFEQFEAP